MRVVLVASVASMLGGFAFGQSLLGQSQPGGGQAQPVVAVPEPPAIVAAPAAPSLRSQSKSVASAPPPQGLIETPLPPPNMVQQPVAPVDNGVGAASTSGSLPIAMPAASSVQAPASSPSVQTASSPSVQTDVAAGNQVAVPTSGVATALPPSGATIPAALPANDVPPAPDNQWVYGHVAKLGVLNKVEGSAGTITIPVGGQVTSGDLVVSVQSCVTRPANELPDTAVFLTLQTAQSTGQDSPVYRGWVIKSQPGSSSAENADEAFSVISCS